MACVVKSTPTNYEHDRYDHYHYHYALADIMSVRLLWARCFQHPVLSPCSSLIVRRNFTLKLNDD
jgi:hypothetical protein